MVAVPNKSELDKGTPFVMLAGQKWPIMRLVIGQTRTVVPALVRLGTTRLSLEDAQQMTDLLEVIYMSLTRAHPTMTRDDFNNMEINSFEMIAALDVIAVQCGWVKPVSPGETQGGQAMPPTGTSSAAGSSPISANRSGGHQTTASVN